MELCNNTYPPSPLLRGGGCIDMYICYVVCSSFAQEGVVLFFMGTAEMILCNKLLTHTHTHTYIYIYIYYQPRPTYRVHFCAPATCEDSIVIPRGVLNQILPPPPSPLPKSGEMFVSYEWDILNSMQNPHPLLYVDRGGTN